MNRSAFKKGSNRGFAKVRDANEAEIVDALEAIGATVTRLSIPHVPDLLVGYAGTTFLVEVKNPRSKGKLSEGQEAWIEAWEGEPVIVAWSIEDALAGMGLGIVSPGMYRKHDGTLATYPRGDSATKERKSR